MLNWDKQGAAYVASLRLVDGRGVKIVLVGPRSNPNGAVVVLPGDEGGPVEKAPVPDRLDLLTPKDVVDVLCAQERAFGDSGLEPLDTP